MELPEEDKEGFLNNRLRLDYENLVIPPKDIGFPQLEELFTFEGERIKVDLESSGKVLFGLRACDLKGILFVDDFFKKNFEDIYYLTRIRERLLILIGCLKPPRDCFCTSTKTGPFLKEGFDLQLVDSGNFYLIEIGSLKGEGFIRENKKYFGVAEEKEIIEGEAVKKRAEEAVSTKVDFEKVIKYISEKEVPQKIYERTGEKCIYCGGCCYVCPTCACFNVFDYKEGDKGGRQRNWDACVFEGYTREASGHNPRKEKWMRTSRRYEHKLKYDYENTGTSGCVGCGRCLSSCPVELGMSKFIEEVSKL